MNEKVTVLWKAPNIAIAQRGPRVLENLDREGKTQFYAPRMDPAGNILYDLDEEYARRILGGQGDRFFLVSPATMIIKRRRADNMGSEYTTLRSVAMTPAAPAEKGSTLSWPDPVVPEAAAGAQAGLSSSPSTEGTTPPASEGATGSESSQAAETAPSPDARQASHGQHGGNGPKKPKATA
jgi:hypothetical protein